MNNQIKIDVVIPTYIKDFDCIMPCINNILLQTIKPNNIIVAVSEINDLQQKSLQDNINRLDYKNIYIYSTKYKQNAAQNRNRGINYCENHTKPDYIMFVDCDDITHTKKIEIFIDYLKKQEISLFVHDYVFKNEDLDIYKNYIYNNNDLYLCYNVIKNTNLFTIPSTKIHHGHPIVKADFCYVIKYNEKMTNGEDGDFCQRINTKFGNVYNFTKPLLKYIN